MAGVRIEVQLDHTIKYVDIVKERDYFKPLSSKNDDEKSDRRRGRGCATTTVSSERV